MCYCYDCGGMDGVDDVRVCGVKERGEGRIENGTFLFCLCRTEDSCCIFAMGMDGVDEGAVCAVLLVWRMREMKKREKKKKKKKGNEARMKWE